MSLAGTLQAELKALQAEAKRKHPAVKDAVDKALTRLTMTPGRGTQPADAKELCATEDVWRAVTSALEAHNAKLAVIALKLLQRCLQHDLVPAGPMVGVVGCVTRIEWDKEFWNDEGLQLTLLQVLLSLFMHPSRNFSSAVHANGLCQCFLLHGSRFNDVQNTSVAALRQLTALVFDRLAATATPSATSLDIGPPDGSSPNKDNVAEMSCKNAYSILKDLCYIADGESGHWLRVQGVPPVRLSALQLVHFVLLNHSQTLLQIPVFGQLVHDQVCQTLARGLGTPVTAMEFKPMLLVFKLVGLMLNEYHAVAADQAEMFITLQFRILENADMPSWSRYLVLLVFKQWAEDSALLQVLLRLPGSQEGDPEHQVVSKLLLAICTFVQRTYAESHTGVPLVFQTGRVQAMRSLRLDSPIDQEQLMNCRPTDALLLSLDSIAGIISAMSQLVASPDALDPSGSVLEGVWTQVLSTLSLLLDRIDDEEVVQAVLRSFQLCALSLGVAERHIARDTFLLALAKHTLPEDVAVLAAYTITLKNVQVLKVLFNLAHGLANHLGQSWTLLLKPFQQLDVLLSCGTEAPTSKKTSSGPASPTATVPAGDAPSGPGDLPLLASLMAGAFEHTKTLPDAAVLALIDALIRTSEETLASGQAGDAPLAPALTLQDSLSKRQRVFGCRKLMEVVLINLHRTELIVDVVYDYLVSVALSSRDPAIRQSSVEFITTIIQAVLTGMDVATASKNPSELQEHIVRVLETLYAKAEHFDVKLVTLNHMYSVINVAGQELRPEAWRILLAVLYTAATGTKTEVQQGYRCLQQICDDYLTHFRHERIHQLISVVGAYTKQVIMEDKVNINLSGIQLLMKLADFCAQHPECVDATHWSWLLLQFRDVSYDIRPEVRNSAMKTLFAALTAHGQQSLPAECWGPCLWDVLLKVLDGVHEEALRAEHLERLGEAVQVEGALKSEQGRPTLMVHHSRDTAVKQWNESRCTALEGVVRMLRVFGERLMAAVPDFLEGLRCVFVHIQQNTLHPAEEVSITGTKSIAVMFADQAEYPEVLWSLAWETWEGLADRLISVDASAKAKVPIAMVDGIMELFQKSKAMGTLPANFPPSNVVRLLAILDKVLRSPAMLDSFVFPSKLQLTILSLFEALPPFSERDLERRCFRLLLRHIPDHSAVRSCLHAQLEDSSAAEAVLAGFGHVEHCRKTLELTERLFCGPHVSPESRQEMLPWLVRMYGAALLTRFIGGGAFTLWKSAIPSFRRVVQLTLPLVSPLPRSKPLDDMWQDLCSALEDFLLFEFRAGSIHRLGPDVGEEEELVVVEMLRDDVLPNCGQSIGTEAVRQLVTIVEECSRMQNKRPLANAGINTLFYLCQRVVRDDCSPNHRVGAVTLPILTARIKSMLVQYVLDDRSTGEAPLPRHRRDEVLFLLNELKNSQLEPQLFEAMEETASSLRTTCPAAYRKKGLLVRLLPTLVEFFTCPDTALKKPVLELLRLTSHELGLVAADGGVPPKG
eukprot:GGOE01052085.1.p1 GENE.GGOE01052085.1~~GGOE01052085.1.p1  ORF type:complete len:1503 (+),score=528.04 GGOE01052085.1:81-4589(+)